MENAKPTDCCALPEAECRKQTPEKPGKGAFLRLPGKLETGDLLLILILFLIWLEKEDEEILILLSALLVMSL